MLCFSSVLHICKENGFSFLFLLVFCLLGSLKFAGFMLKMAGFPPNLHDVNYGFPLIFSSTKEVASSTSKLNPHCHFSTYMDDLACHLVALSLLEQRQRQSQSISKPLLHIPHQRFRPRVQPTRIDSQLQRDLNLSLSPSFEEKGPSSHGHGTELHYHYQILNQAQLQMCSFLESRNTVLTRQQNQNQSFPFQGSGFGSVGGFERVSGGTGVFHPRVLNSSTTASNSEG